MELYRTIWANLNLCKLWLRGLYLEMFEAKETSPKSDLWSKYQIALI